jgi:hypothetical protein
VHNKEVMGKKVFFSWKFKFKGGNSDNLCARVVNFVIYDVVDDKVVTVYPYTDILQYEKINFVPQYDF